jgi:hypothetical protein
MIPHALGSAQSIPKQDGGRKMRKRKSGCEDHYTMTTYMERRRKRRSAGRRMQMRKMKIVEKRRKKRKMKRRKRNPCRWRKTMCKEKLRKTRISAIDECWGEVECVKQGGEKISCWNPHGTKKCVGVVETMQRIYELVDPRRCAEIPEFAPAGGPDGCQWGSAGPGRLL